jgi:hypothetical protein
VPSIVFGTGNGEVNRAMFSHPRGPDQFPRTKHHRWRGVNGRLYFITVLKSNIKGSAGWVLLNAGREGLLQTCVLGCGWPPSCSHGIVPMSVCVQILLLVRTGHVGLVPSLITLF